MGVVIMFPPREPQGSPLGALSGRSWGRLGALLGLFWAPHGPCWSCLEASEGHRKRKSQKI
eukprot:8529534-Pyramimonas_sp.AAC.1